MWSACRSSRRRMPVSLSSPSEARDTAPSGMARCPGTAWRSCRRAESPWRRGAAYRATSMTFTAATSKRKSTESSLAVCTCRTAIPQPGPKFDYKLAWFERLNAHAKSLAQLGQPVILAGDYNVVPTDFDIYDPKSWRKDALLQPETRAAYQKLLDQGWVDALRAVHPEERIYTFWDYFRNHWGRNAGPSHRSPSAQQGARVATRGCERGPVGPR